jgi:hypothetical protein
MDFLLILFSILKNLYHKGFDMPIQVYNPPILDISIFGARQIHNPTPIVIFNVPLMNVTLVQMYFLFHIFHLLLNAMRDLLLEYTLILRRGGGSELVLDIF